MVEAASAEVARRAEASMAAAGATAAAEPEAPQAWGAAVPWVDATAVASSVRESKEAPMAE